MVLRLIVMSGTLAAVTLASLAGTSLPPEVVSAPASSCDQLAGGWAPTALQGAPSPRAHHTAIWTGREVIVWGGRGPSREPLGDGARYDPDPDRWSSLATNTPLEPRFDHTAVWTGTEMIVWGGARVIEANFREEIGDGAIYDVATDSWRTMSALGAPSARRDHNAMWTGREIIIWGGVSLSSSIHDGARYDPVADMWTPLPPLPRGVTGASAIWTGTELMIWGGGTAAIGPGTGALWSPSTNEWTPISTDGAPNTRYYAKLFWTGTRVLLWGGLTSGGFPFGDGGQYDPVRDAWEPVSTHGAPSRRDEPSIIWTGQQLMIWGGATTVGSSRFPTPVADGAAYDPATDSWSPLPEVDLSPRRRHTAVWTGQEMVIFGGDPRFLQSGVGQGAAGVNDGARYRPLC
jgi:N-acetylneuraminic acid mutarotase